MLRFDIINYLIAVNDYKSFLEIGTQAKINFTSVSVDRKVCVDPDTNAGADYQITSDEYFENNFEKFDIVFVDGLHHADFAYRDIVNSLRRLNPGGCIVVHDVIPYSYEAQVIPLQKASDLGTTPWNGDVWKLIVELRTLDYIQLHTIIADHGIAIIKLGKNKNILKINKDFKKLNYKDYYNNHVQFMNTISYEELVKNNFF